MEFAQFTVEGECEVEIKLTWKSEEEMYCREMSLRVNGAYRLQVYLLVRCEEPVKPKNKKDLYLKGKLSRVVFVTKNRLGENLHHVIKQRQLTVIF